MKKVLIAAIALLGLSAQVFAAAPTVFDFANLKYDGSGTALSDFLGFKPSAGGVFRTPGDLYGNQLTFQSGGLTVEVSGLKGMDGVPVVQVHDNSYFNSPSNATGAGLGVLNDTLTYMSSGEYLHLHFGQLVTLATMGMRTQDHDSTWIANANFKWNTDAPGTAFHEVYLPSGSGNYDFSASGFNATSQDFYINYGGTTKDYFYVSSISVAAAIPEPEIYAMLAAGLGLMGFVARRRRQQAAAA